MGLTGSKSSKKPRIDEEYLNSKDRQHNPNFTCDKKDQTNYDDSFPHILKKYESRESKEEPVFVLTRKGSMFLDEEGSMAHEFYEEVNEPGKKPYMRRQHENLMPQGEVYYSTPRLSGDCDIILWDPS